MRFLALTFLQKICFVIKLDVSLTCLAVSTTALDFQPSNNFLLSMSDSATCSKSSKTIGSCTPLCPG
jgi:hypothetical protein